MTGLILQRLHELLVVCWLSSRSSKQLLHSYHTWGISIRTIGFRRWLSLLWWCLLLSLLFLGFFEIHQSGCEKIFGIATTCFRWKFDDDRCVHYVMINPFDDLVHHADLQSLNQVIRCLLLLASFLLLQSQKLLCYLFLRTGKQMHWLLVHVFHLSENASLIVCILGINLVVPGRPRVNG